ncbi:MAG: class I SAM-dependent methyltransferase [Candidatus Peribacteraceae bacterium]|nr:class I SAM-dependent methyltransferase [Candidatus Peribacteraceae bacterium]
MDLPQFKIHANVEEKHWWFLGRLAIIRALLHAISPPSKNTLLLDIGCGTGGVTHALSKEYQCIGIDPIKEAIDFARNRFPETDFRIGDASNDVEDLIKKADCIMLMDVLEHIEDDCLFISKLLEKMKVGAYLFMIAPADPSLWSRHDNGFKNYRRYTIERLQMTWKGLPVKEFLLSYCNSRLYPLIKAARIIGRKMSTTWGPENTDLGTPPHVVNKILQHIFSGEKNHLLRTMQKNGTSYKRGVSVCAIIKRTAGTINQHTRPQNLCQDLHPWLNL